MTRLLRCGPFALLALEIFSERQLDSGELTIRRSRRTDSFLVEVSVHPLLSNPGSSRSDNNSSSSLVRMPFRKVLEAVHCAVPDADDTSRIPIVKKRLNHLALGKLAFLNQQCITLLKPDEEICFDSPRGGAILRPKLAPLKAEWTSEDEGEFSTAVTLVRDHNGELDWSQKLLKMEDRSSGRLENIDEEKLDSPETVYLPKISVQVKFPKSGRKITCECLLPTKHGISLLTKASSEKGVLPEDKFSTAFHSDPVYPVLAISAENSEDRILSSACCSFKSRPSVPELLWPLEGYCNRFQPPQPKLIMGTSLTDVKESRGWWSTELCLLKNGSVRQFHTTPESKIYGSILDMGRLFAEKDSTTIESKNMGFQISSGSLTRSVEGGKCSGQHQVFQLQSANQFLDKEKKTSEKFEQALTEILAHENPKSPKSKLVRKIKSKNTGYLKKIEAGIQRMVISDENSTESELLLSASSILGNPNVHDPKLRQGFGGTFNPLHTDFAEGMLLHDPENEYGCDDYPEGRFDQTLAVNQVLYEDIFAVGQKTGPSATLDERTINEAKAMEDKEEAELKNLTQDVTTRARRAVKKARNRRAGITESPVVEEETENDVDELDTEDEDSEEEKNPKAITEAPPQVLLVVRRGNCWFHEKTIRAMAAFDQKYPLLLFITIMLNII